MLELRNYKASELSALIGGNDNQALQRKLNSWGVEYKFTGRGTNALFQITAIENPFKVYCITELGFAPQTDFEKAKYLYYYFFNDDDFIVLPDEFKEHKMDENNHYVSRQSIAKYIDKLDAKGFVRKHSGNFQYYFAYKDKKILTTVDRYKQAWKEYFYHTKEWMDSINAICFMRQKYGGIARKQEIPDVNGIYTNEIDYMMSLIQESIEADIERHEKNKIL